MNNSSTRKKFSKILLITMGVVIAVGATGYGTYALLHKVKAPTLTNTSSDSQPAAQQAKPAVSPAEAKTTADDAMARADNKVASGDQKGSLADYQIAYDNYVAAGDTHAAKDVQFIIDGIKAAVNAPTNPGKPKGTQTAAK